MQFTTAILALAATAFAAPNADNSARGYQCTFGQYACAKDGASIRQCNIAGNWVEVGPCPAGTSCGYDATNKLPYCFAKTTKRGGGGSKYCSAPGTYSCTADYEGINVCNSQNQVVFNGECPAGTHCQVLSAANNIPFCVQDGW